MFECTIMWAQICGRRHDRQGVRGGNREARNLKPETGRRFSRVDMTDTEFYQNNPKLETLKPGRFARVDMTDKVFGNMGVLQDLVGNGEVERSFMFVDAATCCPSPPPPKVFPPHFPFFFHRGEGAGRMHLDPPSLPPSGRKVGYEHSFRRAEMSKHTHTHTHTHIGGASVQEVCAIWGMHGSWTRTSYLGASQTHRKTVFRSGRIWSGGAQRTRPSADAGAKAIP